MFMFMFISGLSQLVFHLLTGRVGGKNCHFRLRSTTSGTHFEAAKIVNFRLRSTTSGTHFDPHDTHSLRHMTQRMS